jgi:GMP synthase (glutamine-hydrolysing)
MMRIGLLACDHVRPEFRYIAGDYLDMFTRLLAPVGIELTPYDLQSGEFPDNLDEQNGWIATGSRASVYDDEPWIHQYADLVKALYEGGNRYVGICFGSQMIGQALGGTVVQSDRGRGVGIKEVALHGAEPWMDPSATSYRVISSHRDQIEVAPFGARVLGSNPHCPISMLVMDDHFLGIQGHPEFTSEYAGTLMNSRRGTLIPSEVVDAGLASLSEAPDAGMLATWIAKFLLGEE